MRRLTLTRIRPRGRGTELPAGTGWRLQPVEGSMNMARERQSAWVDDRTHDRQPDGPEPDARVVRTYAGGTVVFAFGPDDARDGYEVVTMYPRPRRDEQQGDPR
jgi:hypothetical protein